MTNNKKINAELFQKMIINGAINLQNNYQKIDKLNVFPVPDGDTGNNMRLTMINGIKAIENKKYNSIIEVAYILSKSLLISAKGNSGIILSQFFSGIYKKLKIIDKKTINMQEFIQTFNSGYEQAYKSISEPIEGTILTVIRESIDKIEEDNNQYNNINTLMEKIIQKSKIALKKTPDLLPILKKAKVVDSGGAGFIEILKGMLMFLKGQILQKQKVNNISMLEKNNFEQIHSLDFQNMKYIYCSEFIISLNNEKINLNQIKKELSTQGDSLVSIIDEKILKIHIHTNQPGNILNVLLQYGELNKIKIDNMKSQHEEIINKNKSYNEANKLQPKNNYHIITIVPDSAISKAFKELNTDYIMDYQNDTSLFQIEQLTQYIQNIKIHNTNNQFIIVTNNENIYQIIKKNINIIHNNNIHIIPTVNVAQGYVALLTFDFNLKIEDNLKNIKQKLKNTKTGTIIKNKLQTNHNNFAAIIDQKPMDSQSDLNKISFSLLNKLINKNKEFLTIFWNKKLITNDQLKEIKNFIKNNFSYIEIEIIENNEDNIFYIFAIE